MENLFNSWQDLLRIVLSGVLAYSGMILIVRTSGKRSLSQLKEFDFIVSVALGSTLATVILNKTVALAEGLLAILVLILLQFLAARLSMRSKTFQQAISAPPALIFYDGRFLRESMKKERLMEEEVRAMIRKKGVANLQDVKAVILEPNGEFSVVTGGDVKNPQAAIYSIRPTV